MGGDAVRRSVRRSVRRGVPAIATAARLPIHAGRIRDNTPNSDSSPGVTGVGGVRDSGLSGEAGTGPGR